jgi:hypothetical protein
MDEDNDAREGVLRMLRSFPGVPIAESMVLVTEYLPAGPRELVLSLYL